MHNGRGGVGGLPGRLCFELKENIERFKVFQQPHRSCLHFVHFLNHYAGIDGRTPAHFLLLHVPHPDAAAGARDQCSHAAGLAPVWTHPLPLCGSCILHCMGRLSLEAPVTRSRRKVAVMPWDQQSGKEAHSRWDPI